MVKIKDYLQKHKKLLLFCFVAFVCVVLFVLFQNTKERSPEDQVTLPSPFKVGNLSLVSSSFKDGEIKETIDSTVPVELYFSKPAEVSSVSVSVSPNINLKVGILGKDPTAVRIYPSLPNKWEFGVTYHLTVDTARGQDGSIMEKPINITFTLKRPPDSSRKGY
jgi:hypothetical protein